MRESLLRRCSMQRSRNRRRTFREHKSQHSLAPFLSLELICVETKQRFEGRRSTCCCCCCSVRVHSLLREKKCVRQNQRSKAPNHDRNTFGTKSKFRIPLPPPHFNKRLIAAPTMGQFAHYNDNPASKPSNGCVDQLRHGDCVVRTLVLLLWQRRSVFRMNEL